MTLLLGSRNADGVVVFAAKDEEHSDGPYRRDGARNLPLPRQVGESRNFV
jgi:hypothetical protein